MSRISRFTTHLMGIILALVLIQLIQPESWLPVQAATSTTAASPSSDVGGNFYGSRHDWMLQATQDWYQHDDFWCGIANIHAIQIYDWLYHTNGSDSPPYDNSQAAIYSRLNNPKSNGTISPWGYGGGYVKANISYDTGTDPRAISFGLWYETPPGSKTNSNDSYYFHNWIYHTGSTTATRDFSTDFGVNTVTHFDPISVTIDGGAHSFVVDGVFATSDPTLNGGATVSAIDTWDPWLNRSDQPRIPGILYNTMQNQVWSLADWIDNRVLWGQTYDTGNGEDPEPTRPPLTSNYYVPPFVTNGHIVARHHWNTYYVTIEQDRVGTVDANYAIDQDGHLAPHN